jgi:hypothetical protein
MDRRQDRQSHCLFFSRKPSRLSDKCFVSAFLRQAEEILEIAVSGGSESPNTAIVIDRQGGMRMLDPSGWSLPALSAEFGASSVFKVERRAGAVRVEGMSGSERCLLQRASVAQSLLYTHPGIVRWRPDSNQTSPTLKPMPQLPPSPSAWYC